MDTDNIDFHEKNNQTVTSVLDASKKKTSLYV